MVHKPKGFVSQAWSPKEDTQDSGKSKKFGFNALNFKKRKSKTSDQRNSKRRGKRLSSTLSVDSKLSKGSDTPTSPQDMKYENAPPPLPFGQYLNNVDMQQFEKIGHSMDMDEYVERTQMSPMPSNG